MMYRKAVLNDCKRVYELICELENKRLLFEKFFTIFQMQISSAHYDCLICEEDDKIVGILNLKFEEQLHHAGCVAEIMEFIVDSAYRDRGIGKRLFMTACQIARDYGCVQIEAACNHLRADAHRFYQREGMNNFHFKFSKLLDGENTENRDDKAENIIGR